MDLEKARDRVAARVGLRSILRSLREKLGNDGLIWVVEDVLAELSSASFPGDPFLPAALQAVDGKKLAPVASGPGRARKAPAAARRKLPKASRLATSTVRKVIGQPKEGSPSLPLWKRIYDYCRKHPTKSVFTTGDVVAGLGLSGRNSLVRMEVVRHAVGHAGTSSRAVFRLSKNGFYVDREAK